MVADALVYHPAVAHYMRYVATTVGRDKILRTLQYFSRFYAWYLYRTNNPSTSIAPYNAIKGQLGLTRKVMRVGKFVEHFKAAAELYDKLKASGFAIRASSAADKDKLLQYLQILRQLGYGFYLFFDMLTVADAMGVKKMVRAKEWQRQAYKAWFVGLMSSAVAGIYANWRLRERARAVDEKDAEAKVQGKLIEKQQNATNVQLVSDLCDLTVPSTALGYANFDDGFVGLAGTLSSLLGVYGTWQRTA